MTKDDLRPLAARLLIARERAERAAARFQHLQEDFQEVVAEYARELGLPASTSFDVSTLEFQVAPETEKS